MTTLLTFMYLNTLYHKDLKSIISANEEGAGQRTVPQQTIRPVAEGRHTKVLH